MDHRSARGQCTIEVVVIFVVLFTLILVLEYTATRTKELLPKVQMSRGVK